MALYLLTHFVKLLVVFAISGGICSTLAAEDDRPVFRFRSETKTVVELKEILMPALRDNDVIVKDIDLESCSCNGYTCGCCLSLAVKWLWLNETVCVNITYLPKEFGLELTVSANGVIFIDQKVSVKNPPSLCAGIPGYTELGSLCLKLYNLSLKDSKFNFCAELDLVYAHRIIAAYKLGCFHIPPGSKKMVMYKENQLALEENVLIV